VSDDRLDIKDLTVDLDELTIGEIETVEEITGMPIDRIGDASAPKGKMLRALALVKLRRTDPSVTVEQVGGMRIRLSGGDASPLDVNGSVSV
jgi:hypothetical protein